MTALAYTRAAQPPTRVHAKRLDNAAAIEWAKQWLESHGVHSVILSGRLHIRGEHGAHIVGRLGMWVVMEGGYVEVIDDAEFRAGHEVGE